jgi:hypothetical protein
VDVNTGMIAAGRLQPLIDSRARRTSMADILVQIDRIINAIHDTVPESFWPAIRRKINGPVSADRPMDEFEECDEAEDEYGPVEFVKADEDARRGSAQRWCVPPVGGGSSSSNFASSASRSASSISSERLVRSPLTVRSSIARHSASKPSCEIPYAESS